MINVIRTYATKPYVVVAREGRTPVGAAATRTEAHGLAARELGADAYEIVDLSDVDGFATAAANAGDAEALRVCAIARRSAGGKSRRLVAQWILEGACG